MLPHRLRSSHTVYHRNDEEDKAFCVVAKELTCGHPKWECTHSAILLYKFWCNKSTSVTFTATLHWRTFQRCGEWSTYIHCSMQRHSTLNTVVNSWTALLTADWSIHFTALLKNTWGKVLYSTAHQKIDARLDSHAFAACSFLFWCPVRCPFVLSAGVC